MAQSLDKVLVHVVFSTKHREPLVDDQRRPTLHAYIAGIIGQVRCRSLQVGGTADHVHVLVSLGRTCSVASLAEVVKGSASRWMIRSGVSAFRWQAGYAAFSIGASQCDVVRRYIARQEEHHRRRTFQDELRILLERYGVEYDERYIWE